jgi:HAD superfamily hydrolase (TIGR01458 family)
MAARDLLRRVKAVCFDLSGTLHIDSAAIPGAVDALSRLRRSRPDVPVLFLSNTSKTSRSELADVLRSLGFEDAFGGGPIEAAMLTSLSAAREVVEASRRSPLLLLSDDAAVEFASLEGSVLGPRLGDEPCDVSGCDSVVVGLSPERLTYHGLDAAFQVVQRGGGIIATHVGTHQRGADGLLHLGPGPFVTGLVSACPGARVEVVGKPSAGFFDTALYMLSRQCGRPVERGEVAMVGDDAVQDVKGACDLGMVGVLVRTGKYREGDEGKAPGLVYASVVEFVEDLLLTMAEA